MGVLTESMARLSIKVASPDRTVHVQLSRRDGISASLKPHSLAKHNTGSLSRQLSLALTSALNAYQHAVDQIQAKARDGAPEPDLRGTPIGERRDGFGEALDAIAVSVESPYGYIELDWTGLSTVDVRLNRATLNDLTDEQFLADLNAVLAMAVKEYGAAVAAAHKQVYRDRSDQTYRGGTA